MPRHLFLESLEYRRLLANDLVAFANQLADEGIALYGAHWSEDTTAQRQLFQDGADDLPWVDVTTPNRSLNQFAVDNAISTLPTWIRESDGERRVGVMTLDEIAAFAGIEVPQGNGPTFAMIGDLTIQTESPFHLPIDAYDSLGGALTVTVDVENPQLLDATVLENNRSIRIDMQGYGDMVFELFEQRASDASGRVIELAEDQFYEDIIFHRVIDNFVIQSGDPTGTGRGGSELGFFDDDFHRDLQHNRSGILSFAKSNDDTNNSQFFVTDGPTRFLDFNHSVFGQMVEGDDVREAISGHAVDTEDRPLIDVAIDRIDVFDDVENSIVMLRALGSQTGTTDVTITVSNEEGQIHRETFSVTVEPDNFNNQPFLKTIPAQRGIAGQTFTLQLEHTDVEGDPVEYLSQLVGSDGAIEHEISPEGLVTITPADYFVGVVDYAVAVRPAPGIPRQPSDAVDIQRLNIHFDAPSVPLLVDLQSESDTGSSNVDNITSETQLMFSVSPTVPGDSVNLVVNGTVVSTVVAMETSVDFSYAANSDAGDLQVSAQLDRGDLSMVSERLPVFIDITPPTLNRDALPSGVDAGTLLQVDFTANDALAVEFALSSGPENASLDTNEFSWTPAIGQLGEQPFELVLKDLAGNESTETFSITVFEPIPIDQPLVTVDLIATDQDGNVLTSLEVGQTFLLKLQSSDHRNPFERRGIFAAFADVNFDPTLFEPIGDPTINFSPDFGVTPSGTFAEGMIDELGAAASFSSPSHQETTTIATVEMQAIASGSTQITLDEADDTGHQVLLFGVGEAIASDRVAYGTTTIDIAASWHRSDEPSDVNGDSEVSPRDALAVINLLAVVQGNTLVYEIDRTLYDLNARYDVIPDGMITPRDALFVINELGRRSVGLRSAASESVTLSSKDDDADQASLFEEALFLF